MVGIYRRSVMPASGSYATLDDGAGFSLVPWRQVIEQWLLGQQIAATVRGAGAGAGAGAAWGIGRARGFSIG